MLIIDNVMECFCGKCPYAEDMRQDFITGQIAVGVWQANQEKDTHANPQE